MTIQEKREALAQADVEQYEDMLLFDILMDGCVGYNNITAERINKLYADWLGEDEEE